MTLGEKLKLIFDTGRVSHDISDQQLKDILLIMSNDDKEQQSDKSPDASVEMDMKISNIFKQIIDEFDAEAHKLDLIRDEDDALDEQDQDKPQTNTFSGKFRHSFNELLKAHDHSMSITNKTPENMAIHIDNLRSIVELYFNLKKNVGI